MEVDKPADVKKDTPSPPFVENKPETPSQNSMTPATNSGTNYSQMNNQMQASPQGPSFASQDSPSGQQVTCHQPVPSQQQSSQQSPQHQPQLPPGKINTVIIIKCIWMLKHFLQLESKYYFSI